MGKYNTIKGLDVARYEQVLNAPLLHPLPQNAVLVIGADWCPDTQHTLMDSGYPTQTQDGRPIVYVNDADPETHKLLGTLPGKEILGGGIDSAKPPSRPTREYNYPTVVATRDGALTEVIYADTVPPSGLLVPDQLSRIWKEDAPERERRAQYPRYDADKGDRRFDKNPPNEIKPDTVYAVVSSNCGHCHELMARTDYPKKTDDGQRIVYLNLAISDDGKTPVDPKDYAFYEKHLKAVGVEGFPTFIASDASGKLSIAGVGPDAIIEKLFPKTLAAETARGINPARAEQETPAEAPFAPGAAPAEVPFTPGAATPAASPRDINHEVYMSIRGLSVPDEKNLMGRMTNGAAADIIEKHIYANGATVGNSDRDTKQGDHKLSTNEMGAFSGVLRGDAAKSEALIADLRAAGFLKDVPAPATAVLAAEAKPAPDTAAPALVATEVGSGETPDGNKGIADARKPEQRDASAGLRA